MRFLILLMFALCFADFARAQNCQVVEEGIVKLRAPDIGAFNVWDTVYGEQEQEENFRSGFVRDNGHSVFAGERYVGGDKNVSLILVEYDRRGRMVWEASHSVPGLQEIVKIFAHEDGFVVVGNKHDGPRIDAAWIGVFDAQGVLRYERLIRLPKLQIVARDLVPAAKGKGFVMAASAKAKTANSSFNAVFVVLNSKFQFVSKRSYQPGLENEILGLMPVDGADAFIATGYVRNARGRKNAWAMWLEGDGAIGWQQQYPRGVGAFLKRAVTYDETRVFVVGDALPSGASDARAGWVMMLNAGNGKIAWQRYYTGAHYSYSASDGLVSEDGLVSVLLDAEPRDEGAERDVAMEKGDYVRLLTLDPRGNINNSMQFFNGRGADAYQMLRGAVRERILMGGSDLVYEIENADAPDAPHIVNSREGWAVVAPAMDRYVDPCH